jgi:hypothetical protein
MADIATIAEIGTAAGTLFLGVATFGSTRSANQAARVAERSLLLGLRPVLIPARPEDPDQKIIYGDGRGFRVAAGEALVREIDGVIYLALPLRNVGTGLAVLQRYDINTENPLQEALHPYEDGAQFRSNRHYGPIENFRNQQRDIYIAPSDDGYWQAALRDTQDPLHQAVSDAIAGEPDPISVDLLYGDHEGSQHAVSRFVMIPRGDDRWIASVSFHWTIESADPREVLD